MRRFGSDKPDLRFGVELVECTEYFSDTTFRVFQAPYVGAVVMPGGASQPRRTLDGWQEFAKQRGHKGLAYVLVAEDGDARRPGRQEPLRRRARRRWPPTSAPSRGLHLLRGGHRRRRPGRCSARPASRSPTRLGLIDPAPRGRSPGWWTGRCSSPPTTRRRPATWRSGSGAWTAVHHAFTSPKPESEATFDADPGTALANAYDIVCNGNEIGGGSIRIHRGDVQERVFAMMGIGHDEEPQEKFGFLLDAFELRRAAARRYRVRLGPHQRAAGRRRLDP